MSSLEAVKQEAKDLLTKVGQLFDDSSDRSVPIFDKFVREYEAWFSRSRRLVEQIIPERLRDFDEAYKPRRGTKDRLDYGNYGIADYLHGVTRNDANGESLINTEGACVSRMNTQVAILRAAVAMADSAIRDLRSLIQQELFRADLAGAESLLADGHSRAAGVIAGVILEKHLKTVAVARAIKLSRRPVLSELNDLMRSSNVYDVPQWRFVQRLADVRNLCAHSAEREATKSEVEDLVRGAAKIIAEVS